MTIDHHYPMKDMLNFCMGKNTPIRQDFIIDNLRVEKDLIEPVAVPEEAETAAGARGAGFFLLP